MILRGKLKTGLGEAKYWIEKAQQILEKKTEMQIFHGTLNVVLDEKYKIQNDEVIISGEEYGGTQNLYIDECKVFNNKAFILRTEKNESGKGDHPLTVIEIISNVNFREKYKLKDGNEIIIEI